MRLQANQRMQTHHTPTPPPSLSQWNVCGAMQANSRMMSTDILSSQPFRNGGKRFIEDSALTPVANKRAGALLDCGDLTLRNEHTLMSQLFYPHYEHYQKRFLLISSQSTRITHLTTTTLNNKSSRMTQWYEITSKSARAFIFLWTQSDVPTLLYSPPSPSKITNEATSNNLVDSAQANQHK